MGLVTASSIGFDLAPQYRVKGYFLYDEHEQEIASVRDILVDEEIKVPRYLVIEVGGLMGIQGKMILIPWNAVTVGGMSRLDFPRSLDDVMGAPLAEGGTVIPSYGEEENIHSYFRVEPYWHLADDTLSGNTEEGK
jgi:hypothetical protein